MGEGEEKSALLALGNARLSGREDALEWNYIWQRLWAEHLAQHTHADLRRVAKKWLLNRPAHPGAFAVRRELNRV